MFFLYGLMLNLPRWWPYWISNSKIRNFVWGHLWMFMQQLLVSEKIICPFSCTALSWNNVVSWWLPQFYDRHKKNNISIGPSNQNSYSITELKSQLIRTHYWLWQLCWIFNQHQNRKLCHLAMKCEKFRQR